MLAVLVLIYFGSCSTSAAQRGSTSVGQTFGINLNGGEFTDGKPGSYGDKYVYPGIDYLDFRYGYEMDYLASKRLKLVRYAFRWEQLQHDYYGPLTPLDVQGLDLAFQNAQTHGLHLILDEDIAPLRLFLALQAGQSRRPLVHAALCGTHAGVPYTSSTPVAVSTTIAGPTTNVTRRRYASWYARNASGGMRAKSGYCASCASQITPAM